MTEHIASPACKNFAFAALFKKTGVSANLNSMLPLKLF